MYKILSSFVLNLWKKSAENKRLTFFDKTVFLFFCVLEKFYILAFFVSQFFKKRNGNKIAENLKVISIGNLTVGGTGKSVFAGILVQVLGSDKCALVSRGYGGTKIGRKNFLVSDGKNFFCTPDVCGDEPYMLAHTLHIPVVVGADRFKSCQLLSEAFSGEKKYLILDDAYQNHSVKKDCEILLIDARSPFGNGHCLPAGPLREKDYSRADIIVLTHADQVDSEKISEIKEQLSGFDKNKIFCGRHKQDGLFLFDEDKVNLLEDKDKIDYKDKKFLVVAGIGSFDGFVQGIKNLGVSVDQVLQFPDHHKYTQSDIEKISSIVKTHNLCGVITTQKDWSKLLFLVERRESCPFFVSRVFFEFIEKQGKGDFLWRILKI